MSIKKKFLATILLICFVLITAFSFPSCSSSYEALQNNTATVSNNLSKSNDSIGISSIISSAIPSASKGIDSKGISSLTSSTASSASSDNTIASGAKLKVHYIDVGQGDSEFLELPNGQTLLVDAGNLENGSQIVSYIKGLNHNKIDYLIATHPHADHIGGMASVINGLGIGKIYMPKISTNTKTYEELLTAIKNKGLQVNTAKAGINILKVGNLNIDIIAPVNITGDDMNQYSAVIKVTYGLNKFLFMGDAGLLSEGQITSDVSADVLKIGHHGSDTSSSQTFLNKVHPKYSVIEVGKGNSYGHPTAATLIKLQNIGAMIYRTDKDGTIIFTSDAKNITINKKASSIQEQAPPTSDNNNTSSKITSSTPSENQNVIVYITKTGSKYHRDGCRYLSKSKISISLKDAKARGYDPCSVCNPPQ